MASSLKMYISSEMRTRAASMASSQAGNVSAPLRSSLTALPAEKLVGILDVARGDVGRRCHQRGRAGKPSDNRR